MNNNTNKDVFIELGKLVLHLLKINTKFYEQDLRSRETTKRQLIKFEKRLKLLIDNF